MACAEYAHANIGLPIGLAIDYEATRNLYKSVNTNQVRSVDRQIGEKEPKSINCVEPLFATVAINAVSLDKEQQLLVLIMWSFTHSRFEWSLEEECLDHR